jgi:thiamine-phosphate pyrophosphorylase
MDSRHLAMEAGEAGADYVSFGAFFESQTKVTSKRADPELLRWWSTLFELPVVAIGGITPDRAAPLVAAGADFIATSHAVWNGDEMAAVSAFARALDQGMRLREEA